MSGTGDPRIDVLIDDARAGVTDAAAQLARWRASRRPNPKPEPRLVDENAGRAKVSECRLCRRRVPEVGHIDRHHLVPKGQRGDDVEENLVGLCAPWEPSCHRKVTDNDRDALRALRAALWPEEVAYIVRKRGAAWLDARYPPPLLSD